MEKRKIMIDVSVATGTDLNLLTKRVIEQLLQISNPVRDDQGILTVNDVRIDASIYHFFLEDLKNDPSIAFKVVSASIQDRPIVP